MQPRRVSRWYLVGFLMGWLLLPGVWRAWSAAVPPLYTLTDLGHTAQPYAIDRDSATAVGVQDVGTPPLNFQTATLFNPTPTVLGTLPQGQWSDASGICGSILVGQSSTGPNALLTHAYRRIGTGPLEDLGTTGAASLFSAATDVNCATTAVGYGDSPDGSQGVPLVFTGTQALILATLGTGEGHASATNQGGDIAGDYLTASGQYHCAYWPLSGGMVDCHTPTVATTFSIGLGINTTGQVVGYATTSQGQRGFVWLPFTGMLLLPPLPGDSQSSAYAINDAGNVVGRSVLPNAVCACPALHQAAVLWDNGQPVDLQARVTNSAGWVLTSAMGINNAGVIVGTGMLDGQPHGWMLTPMTPPPTPVTPPPTPIAPPLVQQPPPDPSAPPRLVVEVHGDFNGDGIQDLAGLDATGGIWVCLAEQPSCTQIYG
jgi:probable HAF family extracellular repeat protein